MGRSQEQKKLAELASLHAFKRVCPRFPSGKIEDGEEPDFVISDEATSIGIELTEYFRSDKIGGSRIQEQDALRHHIVDRATAACAGMSPPKLLATVFFSQSERLTKKDIDPTADALLRLLSRKVGKVGSSWKVTNHGQLPRFIEDVVIYHEEALKHAAVTTTQAMWVPEIAQAELQEIAAAKEECIASYRKKCPTIWLLIVVDGFRISSMVKVPTQPESVVSSFDRIFLLKDARTAVEVPVAGAKSG